MPSADVLRCTLCLLCTVRVLHKSVVLGHLELSEAASLLEFFPYEKFSIQDEIRTCVILLHRLNVHLIVCTSLGRENEIPGTIGEIVSASILRKLPHSTDKSIVILDRNNQGSEVTLNGPAMTVIYQSDTSMVAPSCPGQIMTHMTSKLSIRTSTRSIDGI